MNLIRRFREGDRDAFTSIYRAEHPAVFRFAFHMTGDRDKAAEVTQDVFVWWSSRVRGCTSKPVRLHLQRRPPMNYFP